MSLFDWFADRRKGQYVANVKQEPDEGDGLWSKCPECGQVVYLKDLKLNASVCANCGHHHRIDSAERIALIADPDSFQVLNADLSPVDPLGFKDRRAYADRLRESQASTGLRDGVVTGLCRVEGIPMGLAAMDFRFMGGSMGSVVGEKITRLIEESTARKLPLLIVCASGGDGFSLHGGLHGLCGGREDHTPGGESDSSAAASACCLCIGRSTDARGDAQPDADGEDFRGS